MKTKKSRESTWFNFNSPELDVERIIGDVISCASNINCIINWYLGQGNL